MSLVLLHAAATWLLVGLIWFVQVVHYPMLARLGPDGFDEHALFHVRRTSLVVAPAMLAEAGCASWLALAPPSPAAVAPTAVGFALLLAVWLSTALLQVPCHRRLERGYDLAAARRLVGSNWIRTLAWTARGAIALLLLAT